MPSPFPGMDPYLEDPRLWEDAHNSLIVYLRAAIGVLLPPHYAAAVQDRVYIVPDERPVYVPDIAVKTPAPRLDEGGLAIAEASDAPLIIPSFFQWRREPYIEIRSTRDQGRIVTVVEILSPINKVRSQAGGEAYREKQRDLLENRVSLMEIDLLRAGRHTVAAPLDLLPPRSEWSYLVCLRRVYGTQYEVWPVKLRGALPRVRVPLDPHDEDIIVDLQAVLNRCYDEGTYKGLLDYRSGPTLPLSPEDAAWADALLREKGLRP